MSPIIGVIDSQKSGHLSTGASYEPIASFTVSAGGSSQITFNSIPQTYKHLQLRFWAQNNRTANAGACTDIVSFNNDSGANYTVSRVLANGTSSGTITTDTYSGRVGVFGGDSPGNQYNSASFSYTVLDIWDYTNTNKYTTTKTLTMNNNNGGGGNGNLMQFYGGTWQNTAAVSRIDIIPIGAVAQSYVQYSTFCLYGIKG